MEKTQKTKMPIIMKKILPLRKVSTVHKDETHQNGLKNRYVIPKSIEIKGVFLSTKNPVVRLGMIIKYIRKFHLKCNKNFKTNFKFRFFAEINYLKI